MHLENFQNFERFNVSLGFVWEDMGGVDQN